MDMRGQALRPFLCLGSMHYGSNSRVSPPSVPCLSPALGSPLFPGLPVSSLLSPRHVSLVHSLAWCLRTRRAALCPRRQWGWEEATRLGLSSELPAWVPVPAPLYLPPVPNRFHLPH